MNAGEKKYLKLFLFFGITAVVSAAIPELGGNYFSGYDGLGRGVLIALFITTPTTVASLIFLVLLAWNLYKRKHPKV